jgi:hypothetical protein
MIINVDGAHYEGQNTQPLTYGKGVQSDVDLKEVVGKISN